MTGALKDSLELAASGEPFSPEEMRQAMGILLSGKASDAEVAGFLMALRVRGATVEEIAAGVEAMREVAIRVEAPAGAIDTCGTGGDGADTFNISTAVALIVAGAGVPVAKHGSTASSSRSGSAEVLRALGVKLEIEPPVISKCIKEAGVGFMFAALHHRAVKNVMAARRQLGVRTLFNILGPLSNPAGAKRQLIGVYSRDLLRTVAEVMRILGVEAAWVVHGSDGLDELTTTGPSYVAELRDGLVREFMVSPDIAGLPRASLEDLRGGEPAENAAAIKRLLDGEKGAFRDIAVLNAGAALVITGAAPDLAAGARKAEAAIDEGAARHALEELVRISNGGA
ncbi:MAG: anthranilate phosphoribosyltransferase [Pseudomonadota bacterium]